MHKKAKQLKPYFSKSEQQPSLRQRGSSTTSLRNCLCWRSLLAQGRCNNHSNTNVSAERKTASQARLE